MTGHKVLGIFLVVGPLVGACDEQPPPQGPQQLTYQNGYAQTTGQATTSQTTYQNGYAQRTNAPAATTAQPAVTYSPNTTAPAATATTTPQPVPVSGQTDPATQMQTTPVPLGVQPQPLPTPTATTTTVAPTAPPTQPTTKAMATPGAAAFACQSDAQCLLGRCNLQYQRCAYPCKNSDVDCKPGNVCTASGICMPRGAAGVKM